MLPLIPSAMPPQVSRLFLHRIAAPIPNNSLRPRSGLFLDGSVALCFVGLVTVNDVGTGTSDINLL